MPYQLGEPSEIVEPTIAVSFHADAHACPETRSAFADYKPGLPAFLERSQEEGWRVLGHAHPRLRFVLEREWGRLKVEIARPFSRVLAEADVYVVDNSSTGFEFAATGRPVVWMNAKGYRRKVEHGLRFWEVARAGGLMVDRPEELGDAVQAALGGAGRLPDDFLASVYAYRDGHASERAAEAVQALLADG